MSVLADLQTTLGGLQIPIETGVFTDKAPDQYMVVVPLSDTFELHADNAPEGETQEARILSSAVIRSGGSPRRSLAAAHDTPRLFI